ncbi:MAG: DeoR/GlpR transcriptional regulator [Lentisphaeria bacterium]|nr:DeoR/GlpR transcriptional regulator [Lentisphaeria bacterium]
MSPVPGKKKESRQERILKILKTYGRLTVQEAQDLLKISGATVRRCFADLEARGLILRIHGGALFAAGKQGSDGYMFQTQALSRIREKSLIGKEAANLIREHDKLFFDSGTTVLECGNALSRRICAGELHDVTVLTNSLAYNNTLVHHCPVSLSGGSIRCDRMDLTGSAALQGINRHHYTKAFLGADAIGEDGSLYATDEETAALAECAIAHCDHLFILADSGKLGKHAFVTYGKLPLEVKCTLITDSNAPFAMLSKLQKKGVQVITVPATL